MNKRIAFPFLTISDDSVPYTSWLISVDESPLLPVEDYLLHWDYSSSIKLVRDIELNWSKIAEDLGHPKSRLVLELIVHLGTGEGRLPKEMWLAHRTPLTYRSKSTNIELSIFKTPLSKRLFINTQIVLKEETFSQNLLVPNVAGSKLWTDIKDIRLEGGEPRFPVEEISLSEVFKNRPEADALWYLHWQPDTLDYSFSSAIRLYLNSDHPAFVKRFQQQDPFTLQVVLNDVISQIVDRVLPTHDFQTRASEYEDGTLGAYVFTWLKTAFGNLTIKQLKDFSIQKPGDFRAALLSLSKLPELA